MTRVHDEGSRRGFTTGGVTAVQSGGPTGSHAFTGAGSEREGLSGISCVELVDGFRSVLASS